MPEVCPTCGSHDPEVHTHHVGLHQHRVGQDPSLDTEGEGSERWTISYDDDRRKLTTNPPFPVHRTPIEVVPASALTEAEQRAERYQREMDIAQVDRDQAEQRAERAEEGLRRIAEHDWTEPPSLMPDEMAREYLPPTPREDG